MNRGLSGMLVLIAMLGAAPCALADEQANPGDSFADEQADPGDRGRWFTGLNVFPYATDHTFGAGFVAGWTRDFYAVVWRENFLMSLNRRVSDTALERIPRRFSFELTAESVLRLDSVLLYGGVGGAFRHDTLTRIELQNNRFLESTRSEWRVRPVLSLGFVGKLLEASVSVFLDEEPDLRVGLGITSGR